MKHILTLLAVLLLAPWAALQAAEPAPLDRYNVVWESPSQDAHGSMPLGNGDIGLNAWALADGSLHLLISKTDTWDDNARLVKVGAQKLAGKATSTGSWAAYRTDQLGALAFDKPGNYTLAVKPQADSKWRIIGLKSITLTPAS